MDATRSITNPPSQESDQPMSAELLRDLLEDNAIDIGELSILLGGLSKSGTYRYIEHTELRYGQLISVFRLAKSDRVREAILQALLPESGYQVIKLPGAMDFNGDGDVNDRDVIFKTNESIAHAAIAIGKLIGVEKPEDVDAWCDEVRSELGRVIAAATAASAAVDHVQSHAPRRKQLAPKLVGARKAVRRG